MNVISFINQKGGVGKTTTCLNVGACLANHGYEVLLIDMDPQGALTTSAGIDSGDLDTLTEVLRGDADVNDVIVKHSNYGIIPTDVRQAGEIVRFLREVGAEKLLYLRVIKKLKKKYDYVLIDCPPDLNLFTLMGLTASNGIVIPIQAQFLALNGLTQILSTYELVKERLNSKLEIVGYLVTMSDSRKTLDRQVYSSIEKSYPDKIFKTVISNNVALAEAPAYGKDIFEYDPKAKGARQYEALTKEIIERT